MEDIYCSTCVKRGKPECKNPPCVVTNGHPVPTGYVKAPVILDSGDRTTYHTGAVRDLKEKKGRCDLMPLTVVGRFLYPESHQLFEMMDMYIYEGRVSSLYAVLHCIIQELGIVSRESLILDVALHYEEGLTKYAERNWELGIPLHSYIDSAMRHYLKWKRGDTDEPHARAFVWNVLNCIWTHEHFKDDPSIVDLPFNKPGPTK